MGKVVPDSAVDEVGTVVDELSSLGVLHTDLHELLQGRVVSVVPVLELIEVGLDGAGHSFYRHEEVLY